VLIYVVQGTHEEILEFAKQYNGANEKFTFFEKGDVNGASTRQVYSFLKQHLPNEDGTKDIRWNFNIFLVDHEGVPAERYQPSKTPFDDIKPKLEELLKKKEES
jgi:glutathione peroxidase